MLSKDNINKIKEAIIIEGPDDVLNSRDEIVLIILTTIHQLLKITPSFEGYQKYF